MESLYENFDQNISQCTNTNVYTQNKFPIMFNWSPNVNLFFTKMIFKAKFCKV